MYFWTWILDEYQRQKGVFKQNCQTFTSNTQLQTFYNNNNLKCKTDTTNKSIY